MTVLMRFRAPGRDRKTDEIRHQDIRQRVKAAIEAIEKESAGVSRRLEQARDRAAQVMGNLDGIYFEREPSAEADLSSAERQMTIASSRIEALAAQKRKFNLVLRVLDDVDPNGNYVGSLELPG